MLRVATYNAHDCIGRDRVYSPELIAQVVSDLNADFVALQEITLDHAGDLLAQLENATGMRAVDGTLFERGVGRYGNLLLTQHPVLGQRVQDLSFRAREPRGIVDAELVVGGQNDQSDGHSPGPCVERTQRPDRDDFETAGKDFGAGGADG